MSNFRDLFQTTDYTNFVPNNDQATAIKKNFNFVKGSDLYKGVYDIVDADVKNVYVRYYQIAMFSEHEDNDNYSQNENNNAKRVIRSYLFKGQSGTGACFYNYKVIQLKNYSINENDVDKFVNAIKKKSKQNYKNNNELKIVFKYYPVYDFTYTAPPTGDEISQCYSQLLS